eukprot:374577-Karenia_brevis.AAC.1
MSPLHQPSTTLAVTLTFVMSILSLLRLCLLQQVSLVEPRGPTAWTMTEGKGKGGKSQSYKKGAKAGGTKSGKLTAFEADPQKLKN